MSQTKSGIVLQFEFASDDFEHTTGLEKGGTTNSVKVYCSIDLIPVFQIEPINNMKLARLIMEKILGDDPPEWWLRFLIKYVKDYKVIQYLTQSGNGDIRSVGLKTMTFTEGQNHHVKPAQEITATKFSSPRMKEIYTYIKFLKAVLSMDLSSYWVKKELLKTEYQAILDSCTIGGEFGEKDDLALVKILAQPQFKIKFEKKIDFKQSLHLGYIRFSEGY